MLAKLCLLGLGLLSAGLPDGARAAIINVALTGDTGLLTSTTTSDVTGYLQTVQTLRLAHASTGLNVLPAATVAVGDTISGTLTLNGPVTMGPGTNGSSFVTQLYFSLWNLGTTANFLSYSESLTFLNNGSPVALPAGVSANFAGTGNLGLLIGVNGDFSMTPVPTAPVTFTSIAFSASINQILSKGFQSLNAATLAAGAPTLTIATALPPTPVPVPAAAWLLMSGLGAIGFAAKRRAR